LTGTIVRLQLDFTGSDSGSTNSGSHNQGQGNPIRLIRGPGQNTGGNHNNGNHSNGNQNQNGTFIKQFTLVRVVKIEQVAEGFGHGLNGPALVVGPTGLLFDKEANTLLVADTAQNQLVKVFLINETQIDDENNNHNQQLLGQPIRRSNVVTQPIFNNIENNINGNRTVLCDDEPGTEIFFQGPPLQGPLALVLSPFGTVLVSNGDAVVASAKQVDNQVIEFDKNGNLVNQLPIFPAGTAPGGIFGLATTVIGSCKALLVADDINNQLDALVSSVC